MTPLGGGMQVWAEWVAGWHKAETDDERHLDPQPHQDWPTDRERGYQDYWTHPAGHEKRMVARDHKQYYRAALLPDPEPWTGAGK